MTGYRIKQSKEAAAVAHSDRGRDVGWGDPSAGSGPVGFVAVPQPKSALRPAPAVASTIAVLRTHRPDAIVRRTPIDFRNDAPPPDTFPKDTDTMTVGELDAVIKDGTPAYPDDQRQAAIDERVKRELAAISDEAIVLVDTLNNSKVAANVFSRDTKKLFELHRGVVARLIKAVPGVSGQILKPKADKLLSLLSHASAEAVRGVKESRGTWAKATVTKDPELADLAAHIAKNQIKFPGAQGFSNHLEETADSKAHVVDPGIAALATFCGITSAQLHWVVNALMEADREKPGSDIWKRWSALLGEFVALWPDVKPASAKDWVTKALLPTGSKLATHYMGMFAELAEARKILGSGQLLPGTQLTLGKVKQREIHGAMKAGAPADQDVDISFHHKDGTRHYVEVKADPATIVEKIGKDEVKDDLVDDHFKVSDPDLAATPDQVLSYANAKKTHEAKPSKKGRYGSGKRIVLTYSTPKTKNWLAIFTSKAAARLLTHGFDLQLGDCRMDGAALSKVQTHVTKETGAMSGPDKIVWVETNSATKPQDLLSSLG